MDLLQRKKYIELFQGEQELDNRFINIESIDEIGGGGHFSIIFKADDKVSKKKVALKFYDPDQFNDSDRLQRFQREAKVLCHLKDEPLVINIIGDGIRVLKKELTVSGTGLKFNQEFPYIALDLAEKNVADLIYSTNGTDALEYLYVFRELVKSVFRLHRRKICHRDLKPDNFLMQKNDSILLSDLGTSKYMDGSMPDIRDDYINPVGHLYYWSPELFFAMGIADDLVYKADIFALGAILFEMFTGAVYTLQIYNESAFLNFQTINQLFSKMTTQKKIQTYNRIANDLSNSIKPPDICSYNNTVPNCIKQHLNRLYKKLVEVNALKRLSKATSIFRQIDICIILLENELKHKNYRHEMNRRKSIRMDRLRLAYLRSKGFYKNDN